MAQAQRNNLEIYDDVAAQWWSDDIRWVRTLKNLVPGRLAWFDRHFDWTDKSVLDLGCAGGFMAEALTGKADEPVPGKGKWTAHDASEPTPGM